MDFIDISEVQERIQDKKAFHNIDAFFAGYATQVYGGDANLELITFEMAPIIEAFDEKRMKPVEKLGDFVDFLLTVAGEEFKTSIIKKPPGHKRQEETPKDMLVNYFQSIHKKIENDKTLSKAGLYCIGYFLAEHPTLQPQKILKILQNVEKGLSKEFNLKRAKNLLSSLRQALQEIAEPIVQVQAKQNQKEKPVPAKKKKDLETEKVVEKNKKQQDKKENKKEPKSNKKEQKSNKNKKQIIEIDIERSFGGIPLVDSFLISQPTFTAPVQQQIPHFEEPSPKKPPLFEISLQNISLVTSHVIPQARIQQQPPPPVTDINPKRMEFESPIQESDHSSVHTSIIMNLEPDKDFVEEGEPLKNSYSGDQQQLSSFKVPEWQFDTPKRYPFPLKEDSFQTSQRNFWNGYGIFERLFCSRRKRPSTTNKDQNNDTSTPTSQQPFITPFKQDEDFNSLTPKPYQVGTQMTKCSTTMNDSHEMFRASCSICQKKVQARELSNALQNCGHKYCQSCLETLKTSFTSRVQIHDLSLTCPSKGCSKPLCLMDLMDILNDWTLEIYVKYTLENYINDNQDMRCCPTPGCMYAFETTNNHFECVNCKKAYCLKCCTNWHPGQACQKKKSSTKTLKMKECPKCAVWVQKKLESKCLDCKKCKEKFCYDCGKKPQKDYCSCYGDMNYKPMVSPELFHQIMNTCQVDVDFIEKQKNPVVVPVLSNKNLLCEFKIASFNNQTNVSNDEIKKFIRENAQILQELGSDCSNDISYQGSLEEFD